MSASDFFTTRSDPSETAPAPMIPELPIRFERALPGPRSEAEEMQSFLAASPAWVRLESDRLGELLARLAGAVADAMESPRSAHDFLQRLDLRTVSRDHNWRRIFAELSDLSPCFDNHKRTALIRYLQYLSERKRLVDYVRTHQCGLEQTVMARAASLAGCSVEEPAAPSDGTAQGGTVQWLERGETVLLDFTSPKPCPIWLSDRPFVLTPRGGRGAVDARLHLTGPDGYEGPLRVGRNVVGRHPECNLVLDGGLRTVSRVHVLLDWSRELSNLECSADGPRNTGNRFGQVRMTNLSEHGAAVANERVW